MELYVVFSADKNTIYSILYAYKKSFIKQKNIVICQFWIKKNVLDNG